MLIATSPFGKLRVTWRVVQKVTKKFVMMHKKGAFRLLFLPTNSINYLENHAKIPLL